MPYYEKPELRPNITDRVSNWISSKKCCHMDVWLFETEYSDYIFLVRFALGGRRDSILASGCYVVREDYDSNGNPTVNLVPIAPPDMTKLKERTLASRMSATDKYILDMAHWKGVFPMVWGDWRRQYKRHSVMLHYVPIWSGDPTEGTVNYHGRDMDSEHNRAVAELARLLR